MKTPAFKYCSVPNNKSGRAFIKTLRASLNKDRYRVRVRGRAKNRVRFAHMNTAKDVPLAQAECYAIYIDTLTSAKIADQIAMDKYRARVKLEMQAYREQRGL